MAREMSNFENRRIVARTVEIAILLAFPILFHYLLPILIIVPKPYTYLGIALMLPGLALATWAAKTFRKAGTRYELGNKSTALTTSGPFRISRNPMYLAMLIWLAGLAILLGSVTTFIFPILFFLVADFLIIPLEEKNMNQMFGEPYSNYRRLVRRWL